jgi:ankyrin repeat protein
MKFEDILIDFGTRGLRVADVEQFLKEGGDVNHCSATGKALLHYAVEDGNLAVIRLLISRGANLDLQCQHGLTPLHDAVDSSLDFAAQFERPLDMSTVAELIKAGANEKVTGFDGRTPRDVAACYGSQHAIDSYDAISRVPSMNEPTLYEFTVRCVEIINAIGCSAEIRHGDTISVAETALEHTMIWHRFYIGSGTWYHQRHNADFPQLLTASIRDGLASLKKRRAN